MATDTNKKSRKKAAPENPAQEERAPLGQVDERAFRELVAVVELLGVHLLNTSASFHPDKLRDDDDASLELKNNRPEFRGEFHPEQAVLYAGVRFQLTVEQADDEPVVEVFAEYGLFYQLPEGFTCDDETVAHFAGQNGVFNAWPFFREHVCSTVAKMGLPPVVLPVFRLPPGPPR